MKNKKYERNLNVFQSCDKEYDESNVIIYSCPMDATCSFRPGTRFAGNNIRLDSFGMEWYSPYQDKDLKDYNTCDIGDLDLPIGDVNESLNIIYNTTKDIVNDNKIPMMIGGEHLVTYPVVKAVFEKYPDLRIIHFDAHTDLRDEFFGMKFSHATVLRRCYDLLGDNKIYQFGIRSGDRHEFLWAKEHTNLHKFDLNGLEETIEIIKNYPVYITIDLDVLDPSVFPGTGTPEAGGITFKELLNGILSFSKLNNIVGADIVELSPHYDNSGVSNQVASKVLRELVLMLHKDDKDV